MTWPHAPLAPTAAAAAGGGLPDARGVLDAQALARLQELDPGGRAGLVQRVLGTYVQSLQRLLDQVRAARATGDHEAMRHAAHTLKSSSASVGALGLSALCADIEARLRPPGAGDTAALASQVDKLLAEGERILRGLGPR